MEKLQQRAGIVFMFYLLFACSGVIQKVICTDQFSDAETCLATHTDCDGLDFRSQPYIVPYQARWQKREKMMKKYTFNHSLTGIDHRSELSQEEFEQVYDGKWPVLLTDVVTKWPAFSWTKAFFVDNYGDEQVTVKICQGDETYGSVEELRHMLPLLSSTELQQWLYIEDELFFPSHPELQKDLGNIPYLKEDFFSLFPKEVRPWNSMLLWGGHHSKSPLHMDPYNWTGTNAVLKGRKKWKLFPPGQDDLLYVTAGQQCGFPLECRKYNSFIDAFNPDLKTYPKFSDAYSIDFEQKSGELLIIPTGWYHQAYNMEETLAVSGQVMNLHNYLAVLEEIIKVGNLERNIIPKEFEKLSARFQVQAMMDLLPERILARGRHITEIYKRTRDDL